MSIQMDVTYAGTTFSNACINFDKIVVQGSSIRYTLGAYTDDTLATRIMDVVEEGDAFAFENDDSATNIINMCTTHLLSLDQFDTASEV